jgi:hypothetical protein
VTAFDVVTAMTKALDAASVPYMLVGSFSSNLHGIPRSTKDADLVVELGDRSIGVLAPLLGPDFLIDPQTSFETVTATMRYRIRHRASAFLVELFLVSSDPHDQARFARRTQVERDGVTYWVASAEDVVITKLRWARAKDIEDVRDVLSVLGHELDYDYVRHWCSQHGTLARLDELLER